MSGGLRVLLTSASPAERAPIAGQLRAVDVEVDEADPHALNTARPPALVVTCGRDAVELVRAARLRPALGETPVLAIVPAVPASLQAQALAAGATDVATAPLPSAVLVARCRNLAARGRTSVAVAPLLSRTHAILTGEPDDVLALTQVTSLVAETFGLARASLVACIERSAHAYVIAANDAPAASKFALSLDAYPELTRAMRERTPLLIPDVARAEVLAPMAEGLVARGVRSTAVVPLEWRGTNIGALLLRHDQIGLARLDAEGLEVVTLWAALVAGYLRHGPIWQSLRDQTHRVSRARYEAERRLRGIDSLREHFDAASDGVVVLDDGGRMLLVNRAAESLTGFARDGLVGSPLADLVAPDQAAVIVDVVAAVLAGGNVEPFDLMMASTTGAPIEVSVSTSTVLAHAGAVILSLRDVTAERALQAELSSTKVFLERLIDSAVDAIIAANMRGDIILFNQGAERLFGYRAVDVIGKMGVWQLYERGVARQVMRMLRSTSYGGVGRLEQTRREIRTAAGEVVPVALTASILYDGERESATVGIMTDLRDRIRMEQRLLSAQHKLQLSEKAAVIAELAGAAAHELNQPLTSIMAYAELITRQSPAEAGHMRAVRVITSESERMAEIVKKIGRITKYETTDYVGSARVLDLDRAAAQDVNLTVATEHERDFLEDDRNTSEFLLAQAAAAVQGPPPRADDDPVGADAPPAVDGGKSKET